MSDENAKLREALDVSVAAIALLKGSMERIADGDGGRFPVTTSINAIASATLNAVQKMGV